MIRMLKRWWLGLRGSDRSSGAPDPLTEAEVHLSLGRKEQAIEVLEEVIGLHPARRQEFESRIRELRGEPRPAGPAKNP